MIKNTAEIFIKKSKEIHGDKYDYSLVEYKKNNEKVKIICPIHGVFEQTPSKHTNNKQGCSKCGNIKSHNKQKKDIFKFIDQANIIHNEKYDYSLVKYKNNKTKIKIICPTHGVFEQTPDNHLSGKGCKYCGGTSKLDTKIFIEKSKKIHGDKYDYSKTEYINSRSNVKIICPIHGEFEQTPNNHLSKEQGCYECLNIIHDNKSFIEFCSKKHDNKYDYSNIEYVDIKTPVKIICPIHGEFEQRPDSHRDGNGCKICSNNGSSKIEKEIESFLLNKNINFNVKNKEILEGKELDIYIPSHKLAIEINGLYWHSEEFLDQNYHLNKTELCESKNVKLIHIFEDEWLDKKNIVISRLKNLLNLNENRIYARNCEIREVSSKDSKEFLICNHIQGNVNSSIKLGLYYNNELVSLMTFGKLRKTMGNVNVIDKYEIFRFCNILNTTVIGGADKIFKYFIKKYKPKEIISYADRRWSQGNLYEKLGFNFIHNTKPNYFYIVNKSRKYRFNFRKDILIKEGYDNNMSEHDIMLSRRIYRIYDSGNKKYLISFN